MNKIEFFKEITPDSEIHFSRKHGYHNADGTIWINSHNEEQFHFKDILDFVAYWYDEKNKSFLY